ILYGFIIDPEPKGVAIPASELTEVGFFQGSLDKVNKEVLLLSRRQLQPPFGSLIAEKFWAAQLSKDKTIVSARSDLVESNILKFLPELEKYPFRDHFAHNIDYAYATYEQKEKPFSFIEIKYQSEFPGQDSTEYLWRRIIFDHAQKSVVKMNHTLVNNSWLITFFLLNVVIFLAVLGITTLIKILTGLDRK
ncbi:MAG: hypothetical protein JNJ69_08295, partial [Leptospiraceae bacterium]|nr:hypothetical protein [Leptospiraceae bacterium]